MNQRNNNPNQTDRRLLTVSDKDIFVTVQKALLVGIILKNQTRADREESLNELTNLVKTAGSNPTIIQTKRIDRIDPKTFIGKFHHGSTFYHLLLSSGSQPCRTRHFS